MKAFSEGQGEHAQGASATGQTTADQALNPPTGCELEARAQEQYLEADAATARKPYDDALHAAEEAADAHQRNAEIQMRRELAEQDAAERRAQADAVARALRRP
jgi:hypothetical protein